MDIISAHGVPQSYVARGDLYQQHIEESMLLISNEVTVGIYIYHFLFACTEPTSEIVSP